jgi:hypothetical protein
VESCMHFHLHYTSYSPPKIAGKEPQLRSSSCSFLQLPVLCSAKGRVSSLAVGRITSSLSR